MIPIGGNQITNDIAKIFRTTLNHAEQIKISQACALKDLVSMEETINVPSVGGREDRSMSRHTLAEVIEPRFHEILELVYEHIRDSGLFEQVAAGVIAHLMKSMSSKNSKNTPVSPIAMLLLRSWEILNRKVTSIPTYAREGLEFLTTLAIVGVMVLFSGPQ